MAMQTTTPLHIPRSQVDLNTLPTSLYTGEVGSFAHITMVERLPRILRNLIAADQFSDSITSYLEELYVELRTGRVRGLPAR